MKINLTVFGFVLGALTLSCKAEATVFLTTFSGTIISGQDDGNVFTPYWSLDLDLSGRSFNASYLFDNGPGFGHRYTSPGSDRLVSGQGSPFGDISLKIGEYQNGIVLSYGDAEIQGNLFKFFGNSWDGEIMLSLTSVQLPSFVDRPFNAPVNGYGTFVKNVSNDQNTYANFRITAASTRYISGVVPEPVTWIYLTLGFMITGSMVRARRLLPERAL